MISANINFQIVLCHSLPNSVQHNTHYLGSLNKGVFERRTPTGSELYSVLRGHALVENLAKPLPKNAKSSLPVHGGRSRTCLRVFRHSAIVQTVERGANERAEKTTRNRGGGRSE